MKVILCQLISEVSMMQSICAHRIKDEVTQQESITCSVGVSPNKLIAKIASGFQKPDGLTVVRPEDVRDFFSAAGLKNPRNR